MLGLFLLGKNMTKAGTVWKPLNGQGDVGTGTEGDFLLLETGDNVLLETGDDILLEDTTFTPKAGTVWENE